METKEKRLEKSEIDEFIKQVMIDNDGWFDPKSLWGIENPYDVMGRLDQLGCWVHTYKSQFKPDLAINARLVEQMNENFYYAVKYNPENRDENFIQDLFLSHWLNKQCYFSKLGPHNVCFVINKGSTMKIFPGNYIVVQGIRDVTKKDFDLVTSYTEEQMKQLERVC